MHVLSTPPAFILSQNQTLKNIFLKNLNLTNLNYNYWRNKVCFAKLCEYCIHLIDKNTTCWKFINTNLVKTYQFKLFNCKVSLSCSPFGATTIISYHYLSILSTLFLKFFKNFLSKWLQAFILKGFKALKNFIFVAIFLQIDNNLYYYSSSSS